MVKLHLNTISHQLNKILTKNLKEWSINRRKGERKWAFGRGTNWALTKKKLEKKKKAKKKKRSQGGNSSKIAIF